MHFAICIWGLLRSLQFTFPSFQKFILQPLEKDFHTYDILIHTYRYRKAYSNPRNNEFNVTLNESSYLLLNPEYVYFEDYHDFRKRINYPLFEAFGDPFDNHYSSLHFYIAGLNSLYHITKVVENLVFTKQVEYDGIIFVRPDVEFLNPLPVELLPPQKPFGSTQDLAKYRRLLEELMKNSSVFERDPRKIRPSIGVDLCTRVHPLQRETKVRDWWSADPKNPSLYETLYIPDFHRVLPVYNDRMAMGTVSHGLHYGKRFEVIYNYTLHSLLHSETFLKDYLDNMCNVTAIEIPFRFRRVRTNGKYADGDILILPPEDPKYEESPCLHNFQVAHVDWLAYQQRFASLYHQDLRSQQTANGQHLSKNTKKAKITCSYEKIIHKVDRKYHLQRIKKNMESGEENKKKYFFITTYIPPAPGNIHVNESFPEKRFQYSYWIPVNCTRV